uniref:Ig-like domain-containing protein n=1 Tax=Neolamprologus brichardi TaxID=32507 RepID=A0A3Q4I5Y2_NEOBR
RKNPEHLIPKVKASGALVKVGPNAPKIRFKSQSLVTIKLGESAKLSCEATGEPTPRITWISPQKDVMPASSDKFQIMDGGMLLVKKVTLSSEGIYTCLARNSAGDDVKNIKVEAEPQEPFINGVKGRSTTKVLGVSYQTAHLHCRVEGKPEPRVWWVTPYGLSLPAPYLGGPSLAEKPTFSVPNIEMLPIKPDGGELVLECSARGKPNPEFSWILPNGTLLMPGARLQRFTHYLGNGTLRISRPVPADKGVYRCLAKNVAGQAEKRYALEAGRKPVIRGSTGMFSSWNPTCIYISQGASG